MSWILNKPYVCLFPMSLLMMISHYGFKIVLIQEPHCVIIFEHTLEGNTIDGIYVTRKNHLTLADAATTLPESLSRIHTKELGVGDNSVTENQSNLYDDPEMLKAVYSLRF